MSQKEQTRHHQEEILTVDAIVKEITTLVTMPAVYYRILNLVENENSTAAEIGEIIAQDTSLTARLLRIANSAFYGFPSSIETVSRAITVIGLRELRDLVLATSAIEAFDHIPLDLANMTSFWNHSLYTGVCARILATRNKVLHSERLFVAGLLHDIGHLIMFLKLPKQLRNCMVQAGREDIDIQVAERRLLGFDHAELGSALLRYWKLPDSLIQTVQYHHEPALAEKFRQECAIVHVANILAKHANLVEYVSEKTLNYHPAALRLLNFTEDHAEEICAEADLQFNEAREIFLPKAANG